MLIPVFILGLIQLVCLVLVIAKMFEKGETGMGIACAVLSFCTGIGALIAFIYGWIKSSQWGLQKIMLTVCLVLNFGLVIAAALMGALAFPFEAAPAPQVERM